MSIKENPIETIPRIKDNREPIGATLRDNRGEVLDLTGKTILFRMVLTTTPFTVKVAGAAALLDDAANGKVSYTPAAADVDTVGVYAIYFIIDEADPTPDEVFPFDGARLLLDVKEEFTS